MTIYPLIATATLLSRQRGESYVLTGASRRRLQLLQMFANHNLTNCVIKLLYDVILYLSRGFTSPIYV